VPGTKNVKSRFLSSNTTKNLPESNGEKT